MARYTVFVQDQPLNIYELQEPVITIGRLPDNTIPISNMGVSRRHVKIEQDVDGSYTARDLDSLNGTSVNGNKIKKVTLKHGDKIEIGNYTILYECFEQSEPVSARQEENIATNPESFNDIKKSRSGDTARPGSTTEINFRPVQDADNEQDSAVLIEISKRLVYKLDRDFITVGSDDHDDIFADGFMVNKNFAQIELLVDGSYISVNKRMGKLKVNGKTKKSHLLKHKDRIEIGNNTFRYMENG
ncbi:FHA domain-containing protein [Chitinispirillales bacterium ANBcel5]|uniref:FHA domain-containing protein n=1 Tax=Cellulosispirillum alkaliphilum TaxID=3039283 RepID=UPI002A540919|nr:FHA domain-containing protein [Chitinispirillales bacterium ANBcel5]